jgi:hypothetical protein
MSAPKTAERGQPSHAAAQSRLALNRFEDGSCDDVGSPGHSNIWVTAEGYAHAIRGRDDEAAWRWEDFQRQNLSEKLAGHNVLPGLLLVAARGSALPVSYRGTGSANGNRTRI